MLQLLKQMLLTGTHRRVACRRRRTHKLPVGRMEQLEARTVLSASFGAAHVGMEQVETAVASWETAPSAELRIVAEGYVVTGNIASPGKPPELHAVHDAGFADPPHASGIHRAYDGASVPAVPDSWGAKPAFSTSERPLPSWRGFILFFVDPTLSTDVETNIDFESGSVRPADSGNSAPLAAKGFPGPNEAPNDFDPQGGSLSQYDPLRSTGSPPSTGLNIAAVLPSFYATGEETTITTRPTSAFSLRAHDAVFQDFSSQQLLLTAGAGKSDDEEADDDDDDDPRRSKIDGRMVELEAIADSRLRGDVMASLDTLQRERDAIDDVLAELHQLGPFADEHGSDAARTHQPAEAGEEEPVFIADDHRASGDPSYDQPPANGSDSGMVLLQANGDANSSAYDLTAVILNGAGNSLAMPTGAEAAVGVYQAFDVGTAPPRSADAQEAPRGNPVAIGQSASVNRESGA